MSDEIMKKSREVFESYAGMDSPDVPDDEGSSLQVRLHRWQSRNFQSQVSGEIINTLGISEEVGECQDAVSGLVSASGRISHATLKHHQKIRGYDDREKYRAEIADAIADISVYAMQLATCLRLDFWTLVAETAADVMQRDWTKDKVTGGLNE